MPPHGKSKNQEAHRRKEDVQLQGKSGNGRWAGRDKNGVGAKSGEGNDEGPQNEPYVRPLPRWAQNFRKLCPVNALSDRFADNQTRAFVTKQKRSDASSRVDVNLPLLVNERSLLQVRAIAIRAPQVHGLASGRPRRTNTGLPLYCVPKRSVVPDPNSRIHGLPPAIPAISPPFGSRPTS